MTATHSLTAEELTLAYGERTVIEDLDLVVPAGRITAIVGANACGKSTLLRSMSRLLSPRGGRVLLDGRAVHRMPAKELADGALILVGGTLLLTPGFVTDVVGLLLILPPTRPLFRGLLASWTASRVTVAVAGRGSRRPPENVVPGEIVEE